jgi:hypothetical protein
MKHWHWVSLAFLAVVLAAVAVAVPRLGGGGEKATAQGGLTASLDMDTTDGPCTDIDDSVNHGPGDSYYVAICVEGLYQGYPIGSFGFDVMYDDTLNHAPDVANSGNGLDDNPDANVGSTTWGSSLGTGWDCSGGTLAYPAGDRNPATGPGNGDAFLACESLGGPWTLGDNEDHGVIARIHFIADYQGTDLLVIADTSYLAYSSGSTMGECDPDSPYPMTCNDGEDIKSGSAAPTSTATRTPTATSTPCPPEGCPTEEPTPRSWTKTPTPVVTETPTPGGESGEGEQPPPPPPPPPPTGEQMPQVVPPGTGSGPAEGMSWLSMSLWLLAGVGAVSVALGGLYIGYGKGRSR